MFQESFGHFSTRLGEDGAGSPSRRRRERGPGLTHLKGRGGGRVLFVSPSPVRSAQTFGAKGDAAGDGSTVPRPPGTRSSRTGRGDRRRYSPHRPGRQSNTLHCSPPTESQAPPWSSPLQRREEGVGEERGTTSV